MDQQDAGTTSPTLLERVRDRGDHPAWAEFVGRYDPLLRRWSRRYRLDEDSSDELCQRTWDRLWPLMETFQYDPSRRFRSWLWCFFRSRAMDMLGERGAAPSVPLEALGRQEEGRPVASRVEEDAADDPGSGAPALQREAEAAQAAVRARVDAETWAAFWLTTIEERPVTEVAEALGKSYAAVYYGARRVARMLRIEGERRLGGLSGDDRGGDR